MIGLVDLDLQSHKGNTLIPPNIEIMKLATYYQTEMNKFCRLIGLEEEELSAYDKIYVFSESESYPQVPPQFLRADNVEFGGTAFTNGIYVPFENEIIDYTIPRNHIYKEFLRQKAFEGIREKEVTKFLDTGCYRCYAGDNKLPLTPVWRNRNVYFYDMNFFVPDWQNIVNTYIRKGIRQIRTIHPIVCKKVSDFFAVREQPKIAPTSNIIIDLNMPLRDTPYLMKEYKMKFLATVLPSSNIFLTLGGDFYTSRQYYNDFVYKLNLLYIFWSNGIKLKLRYQNPHVGFTDPIQHLSTLAVMWANSERNYNRAIIDRIPKDKGLQDERIERIEKDKLLKAFPGAKTLLMQTFETVSKGGFWRYEY